MLIEAEKKGMGDIMIACWKKKHYYNSNDIVRLEAKSNYTYIYSIAKRPLVVARVLALYEPLLTKIGFIRVHRSHLINPRHINSVDENGVVLLNDSTVIKLPRRKRQVLIRKLNSIY
ncbi:MAG: LytTR family transcriptional regulator [Sphingobacteriales bacterium]|nr:MAG: LytTR family transcriptional regulator [Sphingobacteriales bacterium]